MKNSQLSTLLANMFLIGSCLTYGSIMSVLMLVLALCWTIFIIHDKLKEQKDYSRLEREIREYNKKHKGSNK